MIHHARLSSIVFAVAIALLAGFIIGRIISVTTAASSISTQPITTENTIPVVQIDKMEAGNIIGSIQGDTRVFIGDTLIVPKKDTTFSIAGTLLLTNHISILVPPGMHYVASKQGSKVYSVHSNQGSKLTPKNRVYFHTLQEAINAGYKE
jgi:uncharacterized protein YneF (UPF0154 family)